MAMQSQFGPLHHDIVDGVNALNGTVQQNVIMLTLADSITFFVCQSPELLLWGQVSELADFQIFLVEIEENEPKTLLHSINRHRNLRLNIDAVFVIKTVQVISVQSGTPYVFYL